VLILLVLGALIVALTLTPLGEDARHFLSVVHAAPRRMILSPCGTSEWSAAMRAKHYQANGVSKGKRCGGARACREAPKGRDRPTTGR
jgi:hypothetical protein